MNDILNFQTSGPIQIQDGMTVKGIDAGLATISLPSGSSSVSGKSLDITVTNDIVTVDKLIPMLVTGYSMQSKFIRSK